MKVTHYITNKMNEWVRQYSKQIGLRAVPTILFTTAQVKALPIGMTEGRRTSAYKYQGVCYAEANMVFVNVDKHKTEKELKETLVHELVHMRFVDLSHGEKFEERIKQILKGTRFKNFCEQTRFVRARITRSMRLLFG